MFFPFQRAGRTRINLALQGGGAHGAFTWGVLDCLLEDGRVELDGLSGTSAGAMNAVVLADGWLRGGRDGARSALAEFWTAVAASVPFHAAVPNLNGDAHAASPALKLVMQWSRYFSPYELNPFDHNPLRAILTERIDFARLRAAAVPRLFIAATHANSGRLRLFRNWELTPEVILASACLPTLHHAVEIDGEPYWDGGYAGNPAVHPLVFDCAAQDIVLVLLSPLLHGSGTPRTAAEIQNRTLELAFSANFLREMGMLAHAMSYGGPSRMKLGKLERRLAGSRFHMIDSQDLIGHLSRDTKLAAHLPFLEALRDLGRDRAREWLAENRRHLGRRSSIDVEVLFG
jgi:NTE family protein